MILGGAVMISALVAMSAQIVTLASTFEAAAAARGRVRRRAALCFGGCRGLALEFFGDLFGVGIAQVSDLCVAAARQRRVHVDDQRLDPQALRLFAGQEDAVGAFIGHDFHGRAGFFGPRALIERCDDAHHVGGTGIVQRNYIDGFIAALVEAFDDAHQTMPLLARSEMMSMLPLG